MTHSRQIELTKIPPMSRMLLRAATAKKAKQSTPEFKPLTVKAKGIRADAKKLKMFCDVCEFEYNDYLPVTYPHVMAFALHMQLMLEPEFPFVPMGAVHLRNRISQKRALKRDEALDFSAWVDNAEQVEKGYEVSICTQVHVDGELIWDDLSVMLIRKNGSGIKQDKPNKPTTPEYSAPIEWSLPANKGRKYASASGDYNPIHLYPLTAKAMGFKRHIMHGMWSKSRVAAQLVAPDYSGPLTVDVAFKLPIFLPSTVKFYCTTANSSQAYTYEIKDQNGQKPHLAGTLDHEATLS